jgi:hypothetical protein
MSAMTDSATTKKRWSAAELRKMSAVERDAILEAAAAVAEPEYRDNPELTGFEAYGPEDLHGHSSDAQTR